MEVPEAVEEMTETVIETGLEATIEQIIPIQVNILIDKGQLISKCPFGVFKSPKKPTKFFLGFLP